MLEKLRSRVRDLRRQDLSARAARARPFRDRKQFFLARMAGFAPLDLALARLSSVRSARLRRMAAPAADRPDPRLQADAGGHRRRDTHCRVRRRERLAGASAATGCESEPVVVLELVRHRDQRRQGRSGDRRVAGKSSAASLSAFTRARCTRSECRPAAVWRRCWA